MMKFVFTAGRKPLAQATYMETRGKGHENIGDVHSAANAGQLLKVEPERPEAPQLMPHANDEKLSGLLADALVKVPNTNCLDWAFIDNVV